MLEIFVENVEKVPASSPEHSILRLLCALYGKLHGRVLTRADAYPFMLLDDPIALPYSYRSPYCGAALTIIKEDLGWFLIYHYFSSVKVTKCLASLSVCYIGAYVSCMFHRETTTTFCSAILFMQARALHSEFLRVCRALRPHAVQLVEAFGIPDEVRCPSVIASPAYGPHFC